MKLFLLFLLVSMGIGIFTSKVSTKRLTLVMAGWCLLVMVGYFFFNMI